MKAMVKNLSPQEKTKADSLLDFMAGLVVQWVIEDVEGKKELPPARKYQAKSGKEKAA